MGLYDDVVEVPRRTMVLFFMVDTSGSMSGEKIGAVNSAIEEIIPEIRDISASNSDAEIKIAALSFSTGAQWMMDKPISAESFTWNYMNANGVTDFGEACSMLNEKLSRQHFMSDATGSYAPAIILLSDGEPTDNYRYGLEKLQRNNWFKKAIKVAIAIGENANQEVLREFTGTSESVITVHTPDALKEWIKFVSVRSSEIGGKSYQNTDDRTKSKEIIDEIKGKQERDNPPEIPDEPIQPTPNPSGVSGESIDWDLDFDGEW